MATGAPPPVPAYAVDAKENRIAPRREPGDREWDAIVGAMKERRITALDACGFMTDEVLKRICELGHLTGLRLGGSRQLTDEGLLQLTRAPQLEVLDLSGCKVTDGGLEVLRHLPNLKTFQMTWQSGVSDAGVANLKYCEKLESVNLMGSPTGDGAIEALRGKAGLRRLDTGRLVTDAGLAMLRDFPLFRTWQDERTHLLIDGPFTNHGLASLAGLDGVYALDLFWHVTGITAAGFEVLRGLANLRFAGLRWGAERRRGDAAYRVDAAAAQAAGAGDGGDGRRVRCAEPVGVAGGFLGARVPESYAAGDLTHFRRCRRCGRSV